MNKSFLFLTGLVFTVFPGIAILAFSSSNFSLVMGSLEVLLALGGSYLSTRPGKKNPIKFLSLVPAALLIIFSRGYVSNYAALATGMASSSVNLLTLTLFLWELGICALLAYESSNGLQKVLSESGYDEAEWRSQTGRMTNFMFSIAALTFFSSYLLYLFIISVPRLKINPLFALVFFGIVYLLVTRFYSRSRRPANS